MMKFSRKLELRRDQILVLIAKDFKLKYNSTALGFLWALLVPAFTSIVYYFVFGIMMRFDAPNYLLYLMSGTFLWQFFANVVIMDGGVLMANQGLLKKTSFDRELLIRGTFYTESIHFLLTIPVLFGLMAFYRQPVDVVTIIPNLVICIVSLFLFSTGIGYAYAACNLYFRDLERIINILLMMWMFCSPVFIPVQAFPDKYKWVLDFNPMAMILQLWRDVFYQPGFHPEMYVTLLISSVAIFFLGRAIFRKMEPGFAEMM
jgi:lipopolysaccharide transport system permease protein